MSASENITKRHLGNTMMYRSCLLCEKRIIWDILEWKVQNFYNLNDDIPYVSLVPSQDWKISLIKMNNIVKVRLDTNDSELDIECGIVDDLDISTKFFRVQRINKGIYKMDFHLENYAENKFLVNNMLFLKFKTRVAYEKDNTVIASTDQKQENCRTVISHDLYDMSISPGTNVDSLYDFVIHVENFPFPTHKAILASRSTFFCEYFKENPDAQDINLEIGITYYIMCPLMHFIYTGEVQVLGWRNDDTKLFESALKLGIKRLVLVLAVHLERNITRKNARKVKELGNKAGINKLVTAVDAFLTKNLLLQDFV